MLHVTYVRAKEGSPTRVSILLQTGKSLDTTRHGHNDWRILSYPSDMRVPAMPPSLASEDSAKGGLAANAGTSLVLA